jgi:AraC-like DNA-binding protein
MDHEIFNEAIPSLQYFNNRTNTPNWQIEPAETDFVDLTYVIRGEAIYTINGQKIIAGEGDVLCIPKNSRRAAVSEDPSRFECFAANFFMRNSFTNEEIDVPLPLIFNVGIQNEVITLYRRLNENWLSRNSGYAMRVRAYLMLILQWFMAMAVYDVTTYQYDSRVRKAVRYITDNYANSLTVAEVAEAVSLNPVYFGALFKKETNKTFRDYLNTVRLHQAEDMLRVGKWNVTEVAQNCGFSDVFYFSRLFKKYKGVPPSSVQ